MVYIRWSVVFAIIILLLSVVQQSQSLPTVCNEPLVAAMDAAGAQFTDVMINGWSDIIVADPADEYLEAMVRDAMDKLGFAAEQYQLEKHSSPERRLVRGLAATDRFRGAVICQALHTPWLERRQPEIYLTVTIEGVTDRNSISFWKEMVGTIISNSGGRPRITTCLSGWLDGKLEKDFVSDRLEKAFKAINATMVDTISYKNFVSSSGFSPAIPEALRAGNKLINVNMAMRYSPSEKRTYVVIGSPVITKEY